MEAVGVGIEAGVPERRYGVAVDRVVGGLGVAAQAPRGRRSPCCPTEQPEGRPQALALGQLGADLEVAVGLAEVGFQQARRIAVAPHLGRLRGLTGWAEIVSDAVVEREGVEAKRRAGRALETRAGIDFLLAVLRQGEAVQARPGVAVVGRQIGADRRRIVEVLADRSQPPARRCSSAAGNRRAWNWPTVALRKAIIVPPSLR